MANDVKQERRKIARHMSERLTRAFNMMESSPPFQGKRQIILCIPLLYHACISCQIDLERQMPFHDIDVPDNHKRAAFIFKWISRIQPVRPLGCHSTDNQYETYELQANAYFAMLAALGELNLDMEAFARSPEAKAILYSSMYRDIIPSCWAITFCLLEKAYKIPKEI